MTSLTSLRCTVCGTIHNPDIPQTVCLSCGKVLSASYDLESVRSTFTTDSLSHESLGMWRYAPVLPVRDLRNIVSLGEQITPLLKMAKLGDRLGMDSLWMKEEGQLPTGSFKSRGLAMAVTKAKELGIATICLPSAGNAAGAAAAYAAHAGIVCKVFMPEETPAANIKECRAYGADIELVRGSISDAGKRMKELRLHHPDWFDVSTLKEPYRLEGKKTMGYELAEQSGWNLPEVILYPTGGGTGLIGMWKAFDEMEQLGWIGSRRPRMVSVQSNGCAPIVRAFEARGDRSDFWEGAVTCASGLRVPGPFADYLILQAIYESEGTAIAVPDDRIPSMMTEVAKLEGLFMCPEGAATVLAVIDLLRTGVIRPGERVVLFNTASGLKYPELFPT